MQAEDHASVHNFSVSLFGCCYLIASTSRESGDLVDFPYFAQGFDSMPDASWQTSALLLLLASLLSLTSLTLGFHSQTEGLRQWVLHRNTTHMFTGECRLFKPNMA